MPMRTWQWLHELLSADDPPAGSSDKAAWPLQAALQCDVKAEVKPTGSSSTYQPSRPSGGSTSRVPPAATTSVWTTWAALSNPTADSQTSSSSTWSVTPNISQLRILVIHLCGKVIEYTFGKA
jgi:hypothetical protein